jgi:hypothetical protein
MRRFNSWITIYLMLIVESGHTGYQRMTVTDVIRCGILGFLYGAMASYVGLMHQEKAKPAIDGRSGT